MAVPPVKERIRPKRTTKTEPELIISNPTPISSDFNEDDYLAGRSSVGFVSQRIILTQNSLARESLAADRSSGRSTASAIWLFVQWTSINITYLAY